MPNPSKSKILFICPYFGKFPKYFNLWLKSCSYNRDIYWVVITDDKYDGAVPSNVFIRNISFDDFKAFVQSKFDFQISLNGAYKLCDYKPTYGYLFEEYLKEYTHWGFCDLDCIFGDIRKVIGENNLSGYEKIFGNGHMTIFRNTHDVNRRFMTKITRSYESKYHKPIGDIITYREILSSNDMFFFDEWNTCYWNRLYEHNINYIYEYLNIPVYKNFELIGDLYALSYSFKLIKDYTNEQGYIVDCDIQDMVFVWENGELSCKYVAGSDISDKKLAYLHLQKRDMCINFDNIEECSNYLIIPNSFEEKPHTLTPEDIRRYSADKPFEKAFTMEFFGEQAKNNIDYLKNLFPNGILSGM
ncbi:MAG: hypothetical protein LBL09_03990 [Oscillospiraceae bacterium]|jgi:hypothetical protein|nr:hypothetical protein [Oscillospiraceae bacterium]